MFRVVRKVKAFNLVEVVIAMAVIAFGAAAVMAMLQPSAVAARDSVGDNYSADAASQFLSYFEIEARKSWTSVVGTSAGLSSSPPTQPASISDSSVEKPGDWATPVGASGNIFSSGGTLNASKGIYGLKGGSDFSGQIKIWKMKIDDLRVGNVNVGLPADKGVRFCIEISYPATKPYKIRDRRYFTLEIFK